MWEVSEPEVSCFVVCEESGFFVAAEVCGVEAVGRDVVDLCEEFPCPVDGLLFEVVAEGPVAEHFEECVVVCVSSDVFEVVVFSACADAFLGVDGSFEFSEVCCWVC